MNSDDNITAYNLRNPKSEMRALLLLFTFLLLILPSFAQTIETDDGLIHYEIEGSGIPILIINGGPGMSSEGFRSLSKTLSGNYRTILFDQRGTGQSTLKTISSETITMDNMVDDIERIREHLGVQKWVVLGHSFGGILGSYYASKHPNKTLGLIYSSSGGLDMELLSSLDITSRLSQTDRDSLQYWTRQIASGDTSYQARLNRGKYLAPAYLYDDSLILVIAERLTQGNMTINGLVFSDMRRINYDTKAELENYTKPVLIIQGKYDIIPLSISQKAHQLFPNSTLLVLDQASHYGWLEEPEEYFSAIDVFMNSFEP